MLSPAARGEVCMSGLKLETGQDKEVKDAGKECVIVCVCVYIFGILGVYALLAAGRTAA